MEKPSVLFSVFPLARLLHPEIWEMSDKTKWELGWAPLPLMSQGLIYSIMDHKFQLDL